MFYNLIKHGFLTNQSVQGPIHIIMLSKEDYINLYSSQV